MTGPFRKLPDLRLPAWITFALLVVLPCMDTAVSSSLQGLNASPLGGLPSAVHPPERPTAPRPTDWADGAPSPASGATQDSTATGFAATAGPSGVPLPRTPWASLVEGLAAQSGISLNNLTGLFMDYYHGSGYAVPGGDARLFDGNESVSYPFPLGDVDHDGISDLAIDQFCVDGEGCPPKRSFPSYSPETIMASLRDGTTCLAPHRLVGVSGANSTPLWQYDYHRRGVEAAKSTMEVCVLEFVVGTHPTPLHGQSLLIYRLSIIIPDGADIPFNAATFGLWQFFVAGVVRTADPIKLLVQHDLISIDEKGQELWTKTVYGHLSGYMPAALVANPSFAFHADNLTLLPILEVPSGRGVHIVPSPPTPTLLLRGIGADMVLGSTRNCFIIPLFNTCAEFVPPGFATQPTLAFSYEAFEWGARVDAETGKEIWSRTTYQGSPADPKSVYVQAIPDGVYNAARYLPTTRQLGEAFWTTPPPCCWDVTGDGVPDLVYGVAEWDPYPPAVARNEWSWDSYVEVLDGATGRSAYKLRVTEPGGTDPGPGLIGRYLAPELVGDVNGDGIADYALHIVGFDRDAYQNISLRNGPDGKELWHRQTPRLTWTIPLGGASAGRGGDLAFVEVFPRSGALLYAWDLTNVTQTDVVGFRGADGKPLWHVTTFMAPIDILYLYQTIEMNGLPDLDGDAVGDVPLDDFVLLGDLTYVHRYWFVSGRSGARIQEYPTAGMLAYFALARDFTGDDRADPCILSGDINDLWLTCYDGATATPIWSKRILSPRLSSYALLVPRMVIVPLEGPAAGPRPLVLEIQLSTVTTGFFFYYLATTTQLVTLDGTNGTKMWSWPRQDPHNFGSVVKGATPGTQLYLDRFASPPVSLREQVTTKTVAAVTSPASIGLGLLLFSGGLGWLGAGRWKR